MAESTRTISPQQDQFLKLPEVKKITSRSSVSIWRDEKAGRFPKRRKIGVRSVGWLKSEIVAWLETRETV